jgi:hypothetical protein
MYVQRILTALGIVAFVASAASAATVPAPAATHAARHAATPKPVVPHVVYLKYRVAPADEYFGRLKMSILGIRNTIKDVGLKVDINPAAGPSAMGSVALTEDAMHDWEKKYPQDTWIPPAIFSLERLYAKIDSDDARAHARMTMVWLVHDYPHSIAALVGQKELAQNLVGVKPAPTPAASAPPVDPPGDTAAR